MVFEGGRYATYLRISKKTFYYSLVTLLKTEI